MLRIIRQQKSSGLMALTFVVKATGPSKIFRSLAISMWKKILNDLEKAQSTGVDFGSEYSTWPLDLLADYIEKKYHRYIEEKIPLINEYLTKVCKVHGQGYNSSSEDLLHHMMKEEKILFPYIRKMVSDERQGFSHKSPAFGSIKNPISMMMEEHMTEGDRFAEIA